MDKTSVIGDSIVTNNRPTPDDFVAFFPWAVTQLGSENTVVITKAYQSDYPSTGLSDRSKSRSKNRPRTVQSHADTVSDRDDKTVTTQQVNFDDDALNVITVYDNNEDLVQILFNKNKRIARIVLKTLGIIIKFYPHLRSVVINKGVDLYTIYELGKILPISNITDVCLDGCSVYEANYDILLENDTVLRHLSLARCKIEDLVIENIASKLIYPYSSSKSLSTLNLASNMITDIGAKCLAKALRSNRCLTYLNLSDNVLTDKGAVEILNSLQEFCLTPEEILTSKVRYISFLKTKNDLIACKLKELRLGDPGKAFAKKKSGRSPVPASVRSKKSKAIDREGSLLSVPEATTTNYDSSDTVIHDRAISIVQAALGDFCDPFSSNNTIARHGVSFCIGNNVLCYLNLAFNNLSYIFLKKLLRVLSYQKLLDRKPRGLVCVCIDGNNLPTVCDELIQIEAILGTGLNAHRNNIMLNKKRPQVKVSPR